MCFWRMNRLPYTTLSPSLKRGARAPRLASADFIFACLVETLWGVHLYQIQEVEEAGHGDTCASFFHASCSMRTSMRSGMAAHEEVCNCIFWWADCMADLRTRWKRSAAPFAAGWYSAVQMCHMFLFLRQTVNSWERNWGLLSVTIEQGSPSLLNTQEAEGVKAASGLYYGSLWE